MHRRQDSYCSHLLYRIINIKVSDGGTIREKALEFQGENVAANGDAEWRKFQS